ncbi:hypothetical protein BDE02_03G040600 [Populus trichocarpa]|nr:hypothetical protein BDE02_03G040600 [Populus trichocarpa]
MSFTLAFFTSKYLSFDWIFGMFFLTDIFFVFLSILFYFYFFYSSLSLVFNNARFDAFIYTATGEFCMLLIKLWQFNLSFFISVYLLFCPPSPFFFGTILHSHGM